MKQIPNMESSPELFEPDCEENFFTKKSPDIDKDDPSKSPCPIIPKDSIRSSTKKDLDPDKNCPERGSSSEENSPERLSKSFIVIPKVARRLSVRNTKRKFPSSKRRAINSKAKKRRLRKNSSSDSDFVVSELDKSDSNSEDEGQPKRQTRRVKGKKYCFRKVLSRDFIISDSDNSDASIGDEGKAKSNIGVGDAGKADSNVGVRDAGKADSNVGVRDAGKADSEDGANASLREPGVHKCKICHFSYENYKSLKRHMKTHSQKDKSDFKCRTCKVTFEQKTDLEKHMRTHDGNRPYKCNECDKKFTQSSALKRHEKIHLKVKPFSCSDCGASFTQSSSLKRHQNIHLEVKLFECKFCRAAFIEKHHLEQHVNSIHSDLLDEEHPRFTCNICQAVFSQSSNLWFHKENLHKNNSKFRCKHCSKTFYSNSNLKRHYERVHEASDEEESNIPKPFVCKVCKEGFLKSVSLKLHMRVHVTEDKYRCSACGKAFRYRQFLRRHQESHRCNSGYVCEQCGSKFRSLFQLGLHTKSLNGNCVKDSDTLPFYDSRWQHVCKYCNRRFSLSSRLAKHVRKEHKDEEVFTCDVCEKGFFYYLKFRYHRIIHRYIPYQCKPCEMAFPRYKELLQHRHSHPNSTTIPVASLPPSQDAVSDSNVVADIGVQENASESSPDCDLGKRQENPVGTEDSAGESLEVCNSRKASDSVAESDLTKESGTVDSCSSMEPENPIRQTPNPESIQDPLAPFKDPVSLKCQDCCLVFLGEIGFRKHRRLAHGENKYRCEKCDEGFNLRKVLRLHMRTIHPKPPRVKKKKKKKRKKSDKIIRPKTAKFMSGKYEKRMTKKQRKEMRKLEADAQKESTAFDKLLKAKVKEALARSKLRATAQNRRPFRKRNKYVID